MTIYRTAINLSDEDIAQIFQMLDAEMDKRFAAINDESSPEVDEMMRTFERHVVSGAVGRA